VLDAGSTQRGWHVDEVRVKRSLKKKIVRGRIGRWEKRYTTKSCGYPSGRGDVQVPRKESSKGVVWLRGTLCVPPERFHHQKPRWEPLAQNRQDRRKSGSNGAEPSADNRLKTANKKVNKQRLLKKKRGQKRTPAR